jgi:hypothetical protein
MDDFNEIEFSKLYDEATFAILMAYDFHKKSKILMENGRMKSASDQIQIVRQNAEKLNAIIIKIMVGLEEHQNNMGNDWVFQKTITDEFIGKYGGL